MKDLWLMLKSRAEASVREGLLCCWCSRSPSLPPWSCLLSWVKAGLLVLPSSLAMATLPLLPSSCICPLSSCTPRWQQIDAFSQPLNGFLVFLSTSKFIIFLIQCHFFSVEMRLRIRLVLKKIWCQTTAPWTDPSGQPCISLLSCISLGAPCPHSSLALATGWCEQQGER